MNKVNYLFLSCVFMAILNGCNSAFPENKSSVVSNTQKPQEKICEQPLSKSSSQNTTKASKTYKIIGD